MASLAEVDFFSDPALAANPFEFYEELRAKGPVVLLPNSNVVAVTGYDEGLAVFRDEDHFSAIVAASGPLPPLPFTPTGEEITDQIEQHRPQMPFGEMIVSLDPPAHTRLKSLLMGIITPKRLKDNEEAIWALADEQIDTFLDFEVAEIVADYAMPFTGLVLADLLGIPRDEYSSLEIVRPNIAGELGVGANGNPSNLFESVEGYFAEQVEDRRHTPRGDVISGMAKLLYNDGSVPSAQEVARIAGFLFGAGQGTTARQITSCLRVLGEDIELQDRLRHSRELIPSFVEEMLRLEGSTKTDFRLSKTRVRIGDSEFPPGTVVMLMIGAMNRDPRRFDAPGQLRLERPNLRAHVAFGRGLHACAGAPLARAETTVSLERFLQRMSRIEIDEERHGPRGARRYTYGPTYLLHGLDELHLRFDAVR